MDEEYKKMHERLGAKQEEGVTSGVSRGVPHEEEVQGAWMHRLASSIMRDGKRRLAESMVKEVCLRMRQQGVEDPVSHRVRLRESVMPVVETVSVKRGGASYPVPHPRPRSRQRSLSVRWVVEGARASRKKGKDRSMVMALYSEFKAIENDRAAGGVKQVLTSHAMNKKVTMHRTAKSNRVFAHRRWR